LKTIFYIEMDVMDFIKAARTAETDDQKCELVARALSNGKESLRMWLMKRSKVWEQRDNAIEWAAREYRKMLGPIILEQHIAHPHECESQKTLLRLGNPEWLSRAEARGADARRWDREAIVHALLFSETLPWLCERIDITSIVLSRPNNGFLRRTLSFYSGIATIRTLLNLNHFELAKHVCREILQRKAALENVRWSFVDRHICLAGGGIVLHALLRRKRTRRQMRAMLVAKNASARATSRARDSD